MVKHVIRVCCVAWLAVAIVGCGASSAEIKAKKEDGPGLSEAEKKTREDQMKKSMERSGYGNRNAPPPKQP